MEIERKFLLKEIPTHLPRLNSAVLYQSYLVTTDNIEARIRERIDLCGNNFKLCFKGSGDILRQEVEINITEDKYYELLELVNGEPITKDYSVFNLNGHKLECSMVDEGKPTQFIYAEIEFESLEEANNFIQPDWFGKEVTYDKDYKMKNYWKRTRG